MNWDGRILSDKIKIIFLKKFLPRLEIIFSTHVVTTTVRALSLAKADSRGGRRGEGGGERKAKRARPRHIFWSLVTSISQKLLKIWQKNLAWQLEDIMGFLPSFFFFF